MRIRTLRQLMTASLTAFGIALVTSSAAAAVPTTITHQGRLYDAMSVPVTKSIDIVFTLYDAPDAAGKPIWTETHNVTFDDGYFSVELGKTTPFGATVFDGSVRYLGIKVGTDQEMTPRAATRSVPYALLANDVNGDINPNSVSIPGFGQVIDMNGKWVGDPTGLIGPAGPAGPAGATGATGLTGPAGPTGATGAIGPVGPAGPAGIAGPVGPVGPAGAVGPAGPAGIQGPAGPIGPVGPAGAAGIQGPVGPAGAQGPAGPVGPAGLDGAIGPAGPIGPVGPVGPQGPIGLTGAVGPQGPIGLTGAVGPQGPIGLTGAVGPVGPAGPAGAIGPQGPSGVIAAVYANGLGTGPVDGAVYAFIGTTATASITAANQSLYVSAEKAMGSTAVGGASLLRLAICRRVAGTMVAPVDNGADYIAGIQVAQNQRVPFALSTRFSGLAVGMYEVGLCGFTTAPQAANWNNNEWTRVTVLVAQQ